MKAFKPLVLAVIATPAHFACTQECLRHTLVDVNNKTSQACVAVHVLPSVYTQRCHDGSQDSEKKCAKSPQNTEPPALAPTADVMLYALLERTDNLRNATGSETYPVTRNTPRQ